MRHRRCCTPRGRSGHRCRCRRSPCGVCALALVLRASVPISGEDMTGTTSLRLVHLLVVATTSLTKTLAFKRKYLFVAPYRCFRHVTILASCPSFLFPSRCRAKEGNKPASSRVRCKHLCHNSVTFVSYAPLCRRLCFLPASLSPTRGCASPLCSSVLPPF